MTKQLLLDSFFQEVASLSIKRTDPIRVVDSWSLDWFLSTKENPDICVFLILSNNESIMTLQFLCSSL